MYRWEGIDFEWHNWAYRPPKVAPYNSFHLRDARQFEWRFDSKRIAIIISPHAWLRGFIQNFSFGVEAGVALDLSHNISYTLDGSFPSAIFFFSLLLSLSLPLFLFFWGGELHVECLGWKLPLPTPPAPTRWNLGLSPKIACTIVSLSDLIRIIFHGHRKTLAILLKMKKLLQQWPRTSSIIYDLMSNWFLIRVLMVHYCICTISIVTIFIS